MDTIKNILREILLFLSLDLTKNLKYDRLTRLIMKKSLTANSNCIDIGCHKGEILAEILKLSPNGKHYAFEPIPYLYDALIKKYNDKATIYSCALSDVKGETSFQLVKNAPAYSGIKKRRYDIKNPDIEEINVEVETLDGLIPKEEKIHFVKIDVEGGEFGVMKGAKNLLKTNKPIILFECGKGASEYYNTSSNQLYEFLTQEIGLEIFTLQGFVKQKPSLTLSQFESCFNMNTEYYFLAK